ncbi:MAG: XRE family transcriptional regulator [Shewanella sp.]
MDILNMLVSNEADLKVIRLKNKMMIKIVEKMKLDKLTQRDAALKAHTNQARISRIANGRMSLVTIDFLIRVAVRLEVDISDIVTD